jgi:Acetyltransferase (GNAT) domain
VVASFLDHVAGDAALPKLLMLPLLDESGPVARALRTAFESSGGAHAGFGRHRRAALRPDGDAAHYVARAIGKKRHKEFQRLRRRLAEAGPVAFKVARGPAAVAAALQDFLALEAKGWKGGAGTALIQAPELRRFAETAVDALAVQGQAGVARLLLGSRPIACVVTLQSARGAWCWKIAYDESLARFSPGVQVMMELTDALLADQTVAFADSCATPDHPMIDHLWRERFAMADLMIGLQPGARYRVPPGVGAPPRLRLGTRRSQPLSAVDQ